MFRSKNSTLDLSMASIPSFDDPLIDPDSVHRRRVQWLATFLLFCTIAASITLIAQSLTRGEAATPDVCCVEGVSAADVTILFDSTDALSEEQLRVVNDLVRQINDKLVEGDRLVLLRLDPDAQGHLFQELFAATKPADGSAADPWTENARLLGERYRQTFVEPMAAALSALVQPLEATTSPLLEALYSISQRLDSSPGSLRRELVVVSDMLQNSPLLSQFKSDYSFSALAEERSVYLADLGGLRGVRVTLYQLGNRYAHRQTTKHARFWQDYFQAAGVAELRVVKL